MTQYELWKAVWSSLNDRNLYELARALRRHRHMVRAFLPQTFVGNHDVTRLASRLDEPRHLPHALALLFTLPGDAAVYAGDEMGPEGVKEDRAGGDDAVRPALPARAPPDGAGARRGPAPPPDRGAPSAPVAGDATVAEDELANEHATIRLHDGVRAMRLILVIGDEASPAPAGTVLGWPAAPRCPRTGGHCAWRCDRSDVAVSLGIHWKHTQPGRTGTQKVPRRGKPARRWPPPIRRHPPG